MRGLCATAPSARVAAASTSNSTGNFGYPGATPSISANGSSNGIVWAVENRSGGLLHAYDATDLSRELYNSSQAGSRDQFMNNKFITPMIANGKVYVGTPSVVVVFGLLPLIRERIFSTQLVIVVAVLVAIMVAVIAVMIVVMVAVLHMGPVAIIVMVGDHDTGGKRQHGRKHQNGELHVGLH